MSTPTSDANETLALLRAVEGKAVWKGSEIDYTKEGMHRFSDADIAEIDAGLAAFKASGATDLAQMRSETFPLPTLGNRIKALSHELRFGRGFVLLRGLPRSRYSDDEFALIYFAICIYLGRPHAQSHQGELLGHVLDVSDLQEAQRGYHKGGSQPFHSDACDVVGLICLKASKSGGASRLASMPAIHNVLLNERPDLISALWHGFPHRRTELDAKFGNGVISPKQPLAVFSRTGEGEWSCFYRGGSSAMYRRTGDVMLEPIVFEAIDAIDRLAESEEYFLDMNFHEGDIQFLNNRLVIHSRTDYRDPPEIAERRHLLRVWIAMPDWPAMPENQVLHTDEDHRLWLRRRQPFMEQPSAYVARMTEHAAGAQKATV